MGTGSWVALSAAAWLGLSAALALGADDAPAAGQELFRDLRFERGLAMLGPALGKRVEIGRLVWSDAAEPPIWDVAQWASRFPLATAESERLPDGGVRFANEGKVIEIAPYHDGSRVLLAVNGSVEYPERARKQGEPWVHLLVSQRFECPFTLDQLTALNYHAETRTSRSVKIDRPEYSPHLHAAQYQMFVTVQNLNRQSAGYGDYYWFGIGMYDDRARVRRDFHHGDKGTGKLIYTPGNTTWATASTHDGEWVTFAGDLLPEILKGLQTAWDEGFLKDSRDLADYRLGGMNLGWEVPGVFDVTGETRGLSLRAVPRD